MKQKLVTLLFVLSALLPTALAEGMSAEAADLFGQAVDAHGGEALTGIKGYTDQGAMFTFGPTGEVVQENAFRSYVDYANRRVRSELLQSGELFVVQQADSEGGYAWTAMAGEMPVTEAEAAELLVTLSTGIHGLIGGIDEFDSARVLGELDFSGTIGTGLELVRDGQAVTLLIGEDGRVLGDQYVTSQLGPVHNVYSDYTEVDGVLVPSAYDSYALGMRILGGQLNEIELLSEVSDEVFAVESVSVDDEVEPETLAWLADNVVPFDSVQAGSGFSDLEAFGDMIGDARVVALGEQTHGTAEFFSMKHRLLEYLVTEKGFTIFAIEANMPEAFLIDEYIKTGEGDSQSLLEGLYFWTWYTEEVLDMIEWMHEHNQTAEQTVHFVGFDMQYPNVAVTELRGFLSEAAPEQLAEIEPQLEAVEQSFSLTSVPTPLTSAQIEEISAALNGLEAQADDFTAEPAEVERALQNARIIVQALGVDAGGVAHRDAAMAANVEWLLQQYPDEKMVIWAHNGHVAEADNWMGGHLAESLGDEYFSVAFSFHEGEYRAVDSSGSGQWIHAAEPALVGSIDGVLNQVGPERFYLDLRGAESTPAAAWLAQDRLFRSIGALAVPSNASYSAVNLSDQFDAVIFIREGSASVALDPVE